MYRAFFGLREMPFNLTPDPRYLYLTEQHREAYDHVMYGITQRKGFILLVGEVGSGKTTLCRAILHELGPTTRTALILNPCLNETQLLRAIVGDFGLQPARRDRLTLLETLNVFLLEQMRAGTNVALLIDEAQNLSSRLMEQVRLLSNLETAQQKLIQIVLVGQPELNERLSSHELRQLSQRITVRAHLHRLTQQDLISYIAHRLLVAGATPDAVRFDEAAANAVMVYSDGIPRMVNAVCDNALLAAYVAEKRVIGADCIQRAIGLLRGDTMRKSTPS